MYDSHKRVSVYSDEPESFWFDSNEIDVISSKENNSYVSY